LAEYRDLYAEIRRAGAELAGVAVDPPNGSEGLRRQLDLPFTILCDTKRQIVRSWGVLNSKEKGGIAEAAVFVVDRDGIVRFVSIDTMTARMPAAAILEFLRTGMPEVSANPPRKLLSLGFVNLLRAIRNLIKYGFRTPEK
jgi:peroxiredoxin